MLELIKRLFRGDTTRDRQADPATPALSLKAESLASPRPKKARAKRITKKELRRIERERIERLRAANLETRRLKSEAHAAKLRARADVARTEIAQIARIHAAILFHKRRALLAPNEYGKPSRTTWTEELDKFIATVLPKRLSARKSPSQREMRAIIQREVVRYKAPRFDLQFSGDDPIAFENHVRATFEDLGWSARLTPGSGDQGVDVVAQLRGISIAVQCKWYSSPVGNASVQEVAAGRDYYRCAYGWVVTNASFTAAARQLARTCLIELVPHVELPKRIRDITSRINRAPNIGDSGIDSSAKEKPLKTDPNNGRLS